jgi:hypothetical protein
VVPIVGVTVPFVGATRLGMQGLGAHVGAGVANIPLAWHTDVAVPMSV